MGLDAAGVEALDLGDSFAEVVDVEALRFFNSSAVGAPRFRTGRSGSASACASAAAGEVAAVGAASVAGLFRTGRSESSSDVAGGGAEGAGAEAGGAGEAGPGLAGGAAGASSAGFGFALARRKTGGPSTGSGAGFDMTSLRLAAASFAAAIAAFDCQVPFPIQVLLPCRALLTVNSP
jgi:hypothetical protein